MHQEVSTHGLLTAALPTISYQPSVLQAEGPPADPARTYSRLHYTTLLETVLMSSSTER